MIPYGRQNLDKKDIKEVVNVLKSNWLTQGPKVLEFEKSLARYCGAKYAVVVSNGTAALHLAYLAVGLKRGDKVITTPNTFAATANMILAVDAKPVFCDIRLDAYNIDETKIEKLITAKTKAIVPVHFAGQSCGMEKIKKIARKYKLTVIEDACHALGGKYHGGKIGGCQHSDMSVFSFHPVKSITTGEGGAILTNNKKYYQKLIFLRSHGIYKDNRGKNVMIELGYNYRLTDIQAALGISQLKKLDNFIKKRRQVIKWYEQELKNIKNIILPMELPGNYSAWHIYVIRTAKKKNRGKLVKYLKDNGVGVNFHYPAVYSHPYYQKNGYKNIKLKNMEKYYNDCITLPCFPGLEFSKVKFVCDKIKNFYVDKNN
ncbi:UDP-4-amino-4,6-dideoxy-N-acetyl-beta-L-altrosamine transaminase [Candidatus Falkowbacteria bacterium CG11_big_fil_rev_8_21_14_0_20_39_10]|uniref:UDP-4-amino-4, 6-dideoxy-N-acetyl-beta-L-altrosamine transaminase n=1 Tax=Candidatus Falkowbacteria bacterium CG11_big_fil_rev_8_21_14_0_20_39_10 TaxID=1974570 RepID=A0A2M6K9N8_9BACT|nr:MAG: UDP-4-amino-4,6-dideoxy-N-acetyl-beta-L-altrosamine transaminase [Candidatus Falkowbacteria bacterium CG11_big_fil_rev_8_21_14_0_20_39_10]